MAQQSGKGGGARKYGRQKRSPTHAGQKMRTARNKQAEIDRQNKLSGRPNSEVSVNCLKKRDKRNRVRLFKQHRSRGQQSPRERGERQFGEQATPQHRAQHAAK